MKSKATSRLTKDLGKTRAELDIGYRQYLESLDADYQAIKQRDFYEEPKREIGYHAHMSKAKRRD